MGFNKRILVFEKVVDVYKNNNNIDDVIKYVTTPDAIILHGHNLLLNELVGYCNTNNRTELLNLLNNYIYNK